MSEPVYRLALSWHGALSLQQAGARLWQLLQWLERVYPPARALLATDKPEPSDAEQIWRGAESCTALLEQGEIDWPEEARAAVDPTHELWLQDSYGNVASIITIVTWAPQPGEPAEGTPLSGPSTLGIELRMALHEAPQQEDPLVEDPLADVELESAPSEDEAARLNTAQPPREQARKLFEGMAALLKPDWGFIEPPGWPWRQRVRRSSPGVSWRSYLGHAVPIAEHAQPARVFVLDEAETGARWLLVLPDDASTDDERYPAMIAAAEQSLGRAIAKARSVSQARSAATSTAPPRPAASQPPARKAPSPARPSSRLEPNIRFSTTAAGARPHTDPVTPFERPKSTKPGGEAAREAARRHRPRLEPHPELGGTIAAPKRSALEPHPALGGTVASSRPPSSATPFEASKSPPSAPLTEAPEAVPELSLKQYASLMAEYATFPERTEAIRKKYGIKSPADQSRLDAEFNKRFARDPAEEGTYLGLVVSYSQWYRDNRTS